MRITIRNSNFRAFLDGDSDNDTHSKKTIDRVRPILAENRIQNFVAEYASSMLTLSCTSDGSKPYSSYNITIKLRCHPNHCDILKATCTCPQGKFTQANAKFRGNSSCKHVAALIIHAQTTEITAGSGTPHGVASSISPQNSQRGTMSSTNETYETPRLYETPRDGSALVAPSNSQNVNVTVTPASLHPPPSMQSVSHSTSKATPTTPSTSKSHGKDKDVLDPDVSFVVGASGGKRVDMDIEGRAPSPILAPSPPGQSSPENKTKAEPMSDSVAKTPITRVPGVIRQLPQWMRSKDSVKREKQADKEKEKKKKVTKAKAKSKPGVSKKKRKQEEEEEEEEQLRIQKMCESRKLSSEIELVSTVHGILGGKGKPTSKRVKTSSSPGIGIDLSDDEEEGLLLELQERDDRDPFDIFGTSKAKDGKNVVGIGASIDDHDHDDNDDDISALLRKVEENDVSYLNPVDALMGIGSGKEKERCKSAKAYTNVSISDINITPSRNDDILLDLTNDSFDSPLPELPKKPIKSFRDYMAETLGTSTGK